MRNLVTTFALAACLGACTQVSEYQRPSLAVPATFSSGDRRDVSVGPTWWRAFDSRELDALEDQGFGGNFTVRAAIARIAQARGTEAVAAAPLIPTVGLAGTLRRQTGTSEKTTPEAILQAGYEFDFWGKNRAAADAASYLVDASAYDADTVTLTLAASIANTYFQILSLEERIGQAQHIADDARRILALVQLQQSAGTASELQVEQQRNATATFQANVPVLQQLLDQNMHLLAVLIGVPPAELRIKARDLKGMRLPIPRGGVPSALLTRRPDIRAAEARLVSANFDVGAARAAFLPSITFAGAAGATAKGIGSGFPPLALTDIAGALAQPLVDGGRLQGQLDFSNGRRSEFAETYRQTVLVAFQDVEDALSAQRRLGALAAADVEARDAARRAQTIAATQYRLGGADYLTVLNTQRTLFQAEDAALQVRLLQMQAAVSLFRALGGGFEGAHTPTAVPTAAPTPT